MCSTLFPNETYVNEQINMHCSLLWDKVQMFLVPGEKILFIVGFCKYCLDNRVMLLNSTIEKMDLKKIFLSEKNGRIDINQNTKLINFNFQFKENQSYHGRS